MPASSSIFNFKSTKFIWIKLILFSLIVFILLNKIGNHFEKISKKNQASSYAKQALNTFYNDTKDVELIFLGSSHSYCTFDPEYFDTNLGLYSYQLGTPLQTPDTSYYILKEVLQGSNPKKPKAVVFEIYWGILSNRFELKQADMFLEAVKNESLKNEYIKNVFPFNEKIKYKFKPIRYNQDAMAYYNKKLTEFVEKHRTKKTVENRNYKEYYKDRGFLYTERIMPKEEYFETNQFRNIDGKQWEIDKFQKSYILNLKKLCDKNGIDLYFVTAPVANISMEYIKNYDIIHNKVKQLAIDLNVPYIDYNIINKNENLLQNDDFYDDAHLNNKGALIIQHHFINWLKTLGGIL